MSLLSAEFDLVIDRGVCTVGHGKSIVDAINGVDKNIIIRATARKIKQAADANFDDSKSLSAHVYQDGKGKSSTAVAVKNMLEAHYKLDSKRRVKKEGRHVEDRCYHIRKIDEKLNELKYLRIKFPNEDILFSDMYHYYCCPELGTGRVALRRVACYCKNCDTNITKTWIPGTKAEDQPRFQTIDNCYFSSLLGDENKWYIKTMIESPVSVKEDGDQARYDVLCHKAFNLAGYIDNGVFGAVGGIGTKEIPARHGYWIIQFTGPAYIDQETGKQMCKGIWWDEVAFGTDPWFIPDKQEEILEVHKIVMSDVVMEKVSGTNPPPASNKNSLAQKRPCRVSVRSHAYILDEIVRRDMLEYDPNRVYVVTKHDIDTDEESEAEDDEYYDDEESEEEE